MRNDKDFAAQVQKGRGGIGTEVGGKDGVIEKK